MAQLNPTTQQPWWGILETDNTNEVAELQALLHEDLEYEDEDDIDDSDDDDYDTTIIHDHYYQHPTEDEDGIEDDDDDDLDETTGTHNHYYQYPVAWGASSSSDSGESIDNYVASSDIPTEADDDNDEYETTIIHHHYHQSPIASSASSSFGSDGTVENVIRSDMSSDSDDSTLVNRHSDHEREAEYCERQAAYAERQVAYAEHRPASADHQVAHVMRQTADAVQYTDDAAEEPTLDDLVSSQRIGFRRNPLFDETGRYVGGVYFEDKNKESKLDNGDNNDDDKGPEILIVENAINSQAMPGTSMELENHDRGHYRAPSVLTAVEAVPAPLLTIAEIATSAVPVTEVEAMKYDSAQEDVDTCRDDNYLRTVRITPMPESRKRKADDDDPPSTPIAINKRIRLSSVSRLRKVISYVSLATLGGAAVFGALVATAPDLA